MGIDDAGPEMTPEAGGPRSFVIPAALRHLPEWHAAVAALDAVTKALPPGEVTQVEWVEAVDNAVRGLPYADCCRRCFHLTYPQAATIDGTWLGGAYECARCQTMWTCGYHVDISLLLPGCGT